MEPAPELSVAICTRNRRHQLLKTLAAVARSAEQADVMIEVVVIDNASSDDTVAMVRNFSSISPLPLRYLSEPRPGKCHALNQAIRASRGELIAFLDDDTVPDPTWLIRVWREFQADPALEVLAGRVELANPADLPLMICLRSERQIATRYPDDFDGFGGCCTYRRSLLSRVGDFDPRLGPGSRFQAAEDLDLNYRCWKSGARMLFEPGVVLRHNHGRRSLATKDSLLRGYNLGLGAFLAKHILSGDLRSARMTFWTLRSRARQILRGKEIGVNLRNSAWLLYGMFGYTLRRPFAASRRQGPVDLVASTRMEPGRLP